MIGYSSPNKCTEILIRYASSSEGFDPLNPLLDVPLHQTFMGN